MEDKWEKIYVNSQQIERETEKGVLIKMPNNSKFKGYKFWGSKKLMRNEGGKGYFLSFSLTEHFEFDIFKDGKGKYNKHEKIDERVINGKEMKEAFKDTHSNIRVSKGEGFVED